MPLPRAEQDELYSWALQRVRYERSRSGFSGTHDEGAIISAGYGRFNESLGATVGDLRAAVRRAVTANELGREMTTHGDEAHSPLAHDYPHKPVADARSGRYEYRVVVRASGGGRHVEAIIVFQSRNRLSGDEVMERARTRFETVTAAGDSYRGRVGELGAAFRTEAWIVAATRHQPGR